MTQLHKYTTSAERRTAYCLRLCNTPAAAWPASMPSTARWRIALDRATQLLQTVGQEMQDYSDGRTERWREGQSAERLHENLEQINNLREQLDDLRSNF